MGDRDTPTTVEELARRVCGSDCLDPLAPVAGLTAALRAAGLTDEALRRASPPLLHEEREDHVLCCCGDHLRPIGGGWRPAGESPEHDRDVLVVVRFWIGGRHVTRGFLLRDGWRAEVGGELVSNAPVIAWMPFPSPPATEARNRRDEVVIPRRVAERFVRWANDAATMYEPGTEERAGLAMDAGRVRRALEGEADHG